VHPGTVCLDLAVRRRAFSRAFRGQEALDIADLRRYAEQSTP
jgi:predicted RNA-binding protein YlxR (DUF448 family)